MKARSMKKIQSMVLDDEVGVRQSPSRHLAFVLTLGLILFTGAHAASGQDLLGEPAEATSMTPDSLTVGSHTMDGHMATSQNPDDLVVGSRPLPSPVEAQEPTTLNGMGVSPDSQPGQAYRLSNLPNADAVRQQVHDRTWDSVQASQPSVATPDDLAQAQETLADARSRLDEANAAVGKMIRRNYPTGEPRLRLYDEQKTAQMQVSQAERWVEEFGGSINQ